MFIHDIYILKESDPIEIEAYEEATINLELDKLPPCFHTILTGKIFHKNYLIKNATVMVMDDDCTPLFHTVTDENGVYKFCNMLAPGKYKVIASAIGYKTSKIKTILIRANAVTKLSFEMKKSLIFKNGIVYGKILESGSRKPIEDAVVYLNTSDDSCETFYKTTSNHSGQYLIYNIIPNNYEIVIKKQGYMVTQPLKLTIEKYDRIPLYFDLIRNSNHCKNTISGTITFDKKPISEVAVFLYLLDEQGNEQVVQTQETNEHGLYLFSNVGKGSYLVKAKWQNGEAFERFITIGI